MGEGSGDIGGVRGVERERGQIGKEKMEEGC